MSTENQDLKSGRIFQLRENNISYINAEGLPIYLNDKDILDLLIEASTDSAVFPDDQELSEIVGHMSNPPVSMRKDVDSSSKYMSPSRLALLEAIEKQDLTSDERDELAQKAFRIISKKKGNLSRGERALVKKLSRWFGEEWEDFLPSNLHTEDMLISSFRERDLFITKDIRPFTVESYQCS